MNARMAGETILIVDDDAPLRELIGGFLSGHGYVVREAADAASMRACLAIDRPDLIILDLMMPGEDGLSALRKMQGAHPSVIMLSALGSDIDRIVGLETGADDYLPKPCNPRELLARVRAVLRRPRTDPDAAESYSFAGWRLDLAAHELRAPGGTQVELTSNEFRLLALLARGGRRVRSREELALQLGGQSYESFDRAIDLTISRLRRKLAVHGGAELIRTVRGEGYGFGTDVVGT
jgi:two-component system OmpR family response regulator